ncbi:hypothetical protein DMX05_12710 [Pseudomonas soli]|nr:oligosaccharide flippase family protein [Pseudomonas soli]MDW9405653.1 hypothetical protein [Pseudomonas soli]PYC43151.1 hypothetical protein DMX05_12710 [Pseudomonas soli]
MQRLLSSRVLLRLLNIGIRGGTVLGRFMLIIFLAKFLPKSELGKFGVFVATVLLCVLLVSFEFNKYMYRELFAHGEDVRAKILNTHLKAVFCLYLFSVPLIYTVFHFGLISTDYIFHFYAVLFLVLVSLEMEALLVVLGNQLPASFIFCTQTSLWVFFAIPVLYLFPEYRSLEFVYSSWIMGATLSIVVALWFLRKNKVTISSRGMGGEWVRKGFKKCAIFLLSSLMLKLLLTIDRYTMEFHATPEMVGTYVFYVSVVMGVFNFLEPAVFSFVYPRLLRFHKEANHNGYEAAHKELIYSTVIGVALLSFALGYIVPQVIKLLGLHAYEHDLGSLWFVISAGAVYMLGFIPHYVLYSRGRFNWLSYANAAALGAFLVAVSSLPFHSVISLVACSLLTAFFVSGVVKLYAAYLLPYEYARNV